ncbi:MAG: hypothetical protein ACOZBL_02835 [Patescibacteria group bacterium]
MSSASNASSTAGVHAHAQSATEALIPNADVQAARFVEGTAVAGISVRPTES